VVERGIIQESHIISHGSQDVTLAAARALSTTVADAEQRKRKFGLVGEGTIEGNAALAQSLKLTLSSLFSEISRTAISFETQKNQPLSALVFTGGGATVKGLKEYAQSVIQTEVRLADPFSKTQSPAFLEEILKEAGPEFSVAVGLALRRLQEQG
jgi:Tfp pilus assembly PilM family ATPase